jgi:hypothetical protein
VAGEQQVYDNCLQREDWRGLGAAITVGIAPGVGPSLAKTLLRLIASRGQGALRPLVPPPIRVSPGRDVEGAAQVCAAQGQWPAADLVLPAVPVVRALAFRARLIGAEEGPRPAKTKAIACPKGRPHGMENPIKTLGFI